MDFKSIIKEQREELERIERQERIIERDRLQEAGKYLRHPNILAVIGIRRCGKSIFSYLLAKNSRMGYVNFDDERFAGLKAEELDKILESFYELYGDIEYVILDEIQNIPKWELFASRLRRTKKVILTGSNSEFLSGDLAKHLTGRYIDVHIFPFSFREFLRLRGFAESPAYTTKEKADIMRFLGEYLETGGFPEAYKFGKHIISRIYEDILTKDILLMHKINKLEELKKLAKYLVTNSSEEFTYSKLSKILGVKHISTISRWISYLEDSFLIFKLERFDFKLKQQFIAPKKSYCIDSGIINTIGFRFSENKGRIMENEVAVELQRRKYFEGDEIYYWKDHSQNEVDFVIKNGKHVSQLIQVSNISNREDMRDRETKSLLKAGTELNCTNLLVITWDYDSEEKLGGKVVRFIPFWKWLLTPPS